MSGVRVVCAHASASRVVRHAGGQGVRRECVCAVWGSAKCAHAARDARLVVVSSIQHEWS